MDLRVEELVCLVDDFGKELAFFRILDLGDRELMKIGLEVDSWGLGEIRQNNCRKHKI